MPKKKLNGNVNALAEAFSNVIQEAVEPLATKDDQDAMLNLLKESHNKIKGDQDAMLNLLKETHGRIKSVEKAVDRDRKNTSAQFAEVNKRLGKLEKAVLRSS